jgi:DNA-binding transcriptional regulator YiaG
MKKCKKCKSKLKSDVFEIYEDKLLGIPGVYLRNTVSRDFCPKCQKNQSIVIPNLQGLIAAVAVHRVKQPLKLSAEEIRFLRKACEWKAIELGKKLEVRAETISRWEHGTETMSPQSEKLLRVIVADELSGKAPGIDVDPKALAKMPLQPVSRRRLFMCFEYSADDWKEDKKRVANG